jgi:uncharacterized membrane protein
MKMFFAHTQYLPVALPFFFAFVFTLALLLFLLQIHVLRYAYMRLGVSSGAAMALLFGSLLGSAINIPIAQLGPERLARSGEVLYYGMLYIVPQSFGQRGVILAVNVGGAVIPTALSLYLLSKRQIWGSGFFVTAIMAAICHALAEPVPGVGIALPTFAPPIAAALVAAVASWRELAPLAYVGGSIGVLIGADLTNLDKIRGLGAPVASIGGAGTFDGIFVTGVFAVLLAGFARGGDVEQPRRHGAS